MPCPLTPPAQSPQTPQKITAAHCTSVAGVSPALLTSPSPALSNLLNSGSHHDAFLVVGLSLPQARHSTEAEDFSLLSAPPIISSHFHFPHPLR